VYGFLFAYSELLDHKYFSFTKSAIEDIGIIDAPHHSSTLLEIDGVWLQLFDFMLRNQHWVFVGMELIYVDVLSREQNHAMALLETHCLYLKIGEGYRLLSETVEVEELYFLIDCNNKPILLNPKAPNFPIVLDLHNFSRFIGKQHPMVGHPPIPNIPSSLILDEGPDEEGVPDFDGLLKGDNEAVVLHIHAGETAVVFGNGQHGVLDLLGLELLGGHCLGDEVVVVVVVGVFLGFQVGGFDEHMDFGHVEPFLCG
jgi:hypothetical protein